MSGNKNSVVRTSLEKPRDVPKEDLNTLESANKDSILPTSLEKSKDSFKEKPPLGPSDKIASKEKIKESNVF